MKRTSDVIAIVLAAGAGSRMGGSKALLLLDTREGGEAEAQAGAGDARDRSLAMLHARRLREAGCHEVILVTRPELAPLFEDAPLADAPALSGDPLAGPLASNALRVAISTEADQSGSLAVGLRKAGVTRAPDPQEDDAILVITPVDAVPARVATIERLIAAVRAGVEAATPRHAGRGGHPVVVRARVLMAREASDARGSLLPLRDILNALGVRRLNFDVDDDAIGTDLDTPADVTALTGAAPKFCE